MADVFEKDLKTFFGPPFGVKAKITSGRKKGKFINGIFETSYRDLEFGKMNLVTDSSVLLCTAEDAIGLKEEDTIRFDQKNYMISTISKDHTGMAILDLAEDIV